jgi:putative SOS response-associated peptidase YedK
LVVLTEDEIRDMFWGLKPKLKQNDNNENTTENIRSV